jgi:hypothetical protein
MARTTKPRGTNGFPALDDFVDDGGTREAFQAVAIKEVLAWQIEQAMMSPRDGERDVPDPIARIQP